MDIPGLNLGPAPAAAAAPANTVDLPPEHEWRFEVALDAEVQLQLVAGTAEIFGTEIAGGVTYKFSAAKLAVFTYQGCRLEWTGEAQVEYTSDETPMSAYLNLHFALEKQRMLAQERDLLSRASAAVGLAPAGAGGEGEGPKVLILGPEGSGKSTLAKILTAYAIKMGRAPMVVNLDPRESMTGVPPGTLTAASYSTLMDVEDNVWGTCPTNGPSPSAPKTPIGYYYGADSPTTNPAFYRALATRLSLAVASRLAVDDKVRVSGTIIDTAGVVDQRHYDIIEGVVGDFGVTAVVIIGNERLFNDMKRKYAGAPGMAVLKIARSGGVVDRDAAYVRAVQQRTIKEYFYGSARNMLSAYAVTVDYSTLTVYEIGEKSHLVSSSVLPIGDDQATAQLTPVTKLEPSSQMQNAVLAILYANPGDADADVAVASVMGFVHVVEADDTKRKLKVLIPIQGRLPSRVLLMGQFRYVE
ncbi:Pre-mRNA cleavage complex II protein Clp1-domain-containing protein [Dipodascopsis tothii]|uniref:Pre-mRNA cleavage complex II protein Clp1-domain-containing protein n=1 Tax=Dipodascopsis tothii TaxID=44089 RepID=UPI0034CEE954